MQPAAHLCSSLQWHRDTYEDLEDGVGVSGVILFSWLYIIEMQMIFALNFVLLYFQKMTWNSHSMPITLNGYSIFKTVGREEQRQMKTSVSEDVNYWLTFVWTLLGMRIREMSNRRSRRAAWAISRALLTDDTTKGESELARGREEGEAPLWVYKFMLYPWPNTQTVSFHAAAYYYTHCFILLILQLFKPLYTEPTMIH